MAGQHKAGDPRRGVTRNGKLFEPPLRPFIQHFGKLTLDLGPIQALGIGQAIAHQQSFDDVVPHAYPENSLTGLLALPVAALALGVRSGRAVEHGVFAFFARFTPSSSF